MANSFPFRHQVRVDLRTCQDRTTRHELAFERQMHALIDAYMEWSVSNDNRDGAGYFCAPKPGDISADSGSVKIKVVDVFSKFVSGSMVFVLNLLFNSLEKCSISSYTSNGQVHSFHPCSAGHNAMFTNFAFSGHHYTLPRAVPHYPPSRSPPVNTVLGEVAMQSSIST